MSPIGQRRRNTFFVLKSMMKWKEESSWSFAFSLFLQVLILWGKCVQVTIGSNHCPVMWASKLAVICRTSSGAKLFNRGGNWTPAWEAHQQIRKKKTCWTTPFARILLCILSTFSMLDCLTVLWGKYHYRHFISDKIHSEVYIASLPASFFVVLSSSSIHLLIKLERAPTENRH